MLTVADRPVVRLLRLNLNFPSYTRLPSRELEDNMGDVTALKGTRVVFSVETNKDLAEATVVFSDSSRLAMKIDGQAVELYTLTNANSGKCLDVPGASTADGVQLQQWSCNGTAAQSLDVDRWLSRHGNAVCSGGSAGMPGSPGNKLSG